MPEPFGDFYILDPAIPDEKSELKTFFTKSAE